MSTVVDQIKCGHCTGYHPSVDDVRKCAAAHGVGTSAPTAPAPAPAVTLPAAIPARYMPPLGGPKWWYDKVSQPQLTKITKLGGDETLAWRLNKKGASTYIDDLLDKRVAAPRPTPSDGHPFVWGSRGRSGEDICATCSQEHPAPEGKVEPLSPLKALLPGLADGYYAARLEEGSPFKFFRISRPKRGKFADAIKVQTQSGPSLDLYASYYEGSGRLYTYQYGRFDKEIMLVFADQKWAAMKYGQELGHCCRCNTELTDERSRWYGIGPECEKYWPEIIEMVERDKGVFSL